MKFYSTYIFVFDGNGYLYEYGTLVYDGPGEFFSTVKNSLTSCGVPFGQNFDLDSEVAFDGCTFT